MRGKEGSAGVGGRRRRDVSWDGVWITGLPNLIWMGVLICRQWNLVATNWSLKAWVCFVTPEINPPVDQVDAKGQGCWR